MPETTPTPTTSTTTGTSIPALSNRLFDVAFLKNDGSNYTTWSFRVKHILMQRGIWEIVSGTEACPAETDKVGRADWTSRDSIAFTQITLTLEDEPLAACMYLTSSEAVWTKLATMYEGKGKQTIASLIGELFRGTLSDDSPLRPQLDAMLHKKHVLASLGQKLDDSLIAIAMLISLPPSYDTLRTILMHHMLWY